MSDEGSVRDRLIDAGVDLVMARGAGDLGLREIARAAGVSHGAPRRYFPTHHSLLSAIAHRGFAALEARFDAAGQGAATPRDHLRALARAYVRYAVECPGMFELMFRHDLLNGDGQDHGGPRLRERTLPLFERVVSLVGESRRGGGGSAQAPPPAVAAAALWANVHGLVQLWTWESLRLALPHDHTGGGTSDGDGDGGGTSDGGTSDGDGDGGGTSDGGTSDGDVDGGLLDRLVSAALDAHLGPEPA
ncbi:TetR/AcrR family transcriptional regulator [Nonomuraea sp. SMC257]|uniref:TetR/AcrR family transcriptional regulator n=1 Tax=Nonomuraea montanisoli TaxID=2741721 RepID=A0A7Y6I7F4_9ACTN|nr:TetR/AcrR family transcriptional regulator [Nonomuraea montanisoli]NUW33102.1 TetR/AcrR family transcriptional regulator [Nonomuraea montanisoli]